MSPPVDQLTPPADFIGFNDRGAFRNYERNLPHWRQPGATYFLTFRLNDSLPAGIIAEHQREQESWRERIAHERELLGGISQETAADYETFQIRACRKIEGFLDEGHGSCVLKDPVPRKIVCDALLHFHGDRGQVHGFAVMPNHVHISLKPCCIPGSGSQPARSIKPSVKRVNSGSTTPGIASSGMRITGSEPYVTR